MPHGREQIRDAIVTLVTGLTTTGANVFQSRIYPLAESTDLPGLCVYTFNEEIDEEKGKIEKLDFRYLTVKVDGYAKLIAGLDDTLDDIAQEVEVAVLADQRLGGLSTLIDLLETEIEVKTESEKPVGVVSMSFKVGYLTATGTPQTIIT